MNALAVCSHCRRLRAGHCRGLCRPCFNDLAVRLLYAARGRGPRGGSYHTASVGTPNRPPAAWPDPTAALPGTAAKVAELERRAAAGLHLFHPQDAQAPEE